LLTRSFAQIACLARLYLAAFCLAGLCLSTIACRDVEYPVPAQLSTPKYRIDAILDRDRTHSSFPESSVISGVQPDIQHYGWSWTNPRAILQFPLNQAEGWDFTARITSIADVLAKSGPQTVTFSINGQIVKTARLDRAGTVEIEFPVSAGLLTQPAKTDVVMATQPCLAQASGPPLCVLLQRIGFTREPF
jgi:hypothetical protein